MLRLENEWIAASFERLPFPARVRDKRSEVSLNGLSADGSLQIDGVSVALQDIQAEWTDSHCLLTLPDRRQLSVTVSLDGRSLHLHVAAVPEKGLIRHLNGRDMPLLSAGQDFSLFRDRFMYRHWYETIGPGLARTVLDCGPVLDCFPDGSVQEGVHACIFSGQSCFSIISNEHYLPLASRVSAHKEFPYRGGGISLGFGHASLQRCGKPCGLHLQIRLCPDINGDGAADECDYQLDLKQHLPDPDPLYRDATWYKIYLGNSGRVDTTYAEALELIARISRMISGARQIVYLVGYQGEGHDSDYPTLHRLNPGPGTPKELAGLIKAAREQYNAVVSLHINLDDAYREHIGWDPEIISRRPDGDLFKWECFNNKQSYHINHTADVAAGKVFRRLELLLQAVPLKDTIHIDAFRNTNFSWQPDCFTGPLEELYSGQMPILNYLRERGIDPTTESYNGMTIEMAGVFSAVLHNSGLLPLLYQNKLYGGGQGDHPVALVRGSSLNSDYTRQNLDREDTTVLDEIALSSLLYRYFQRRDMIEFRVRDNEREAYARFSDGTTAIGRSWPASLDVRSGDILVADLDTRFVPLDNVILAWSRQGGSMTRKLPPGYFGKKLSFQLVDSRGDERDDYQVSQSRPDTIEITLPARTILQIRQDKT